MLPDALRALDTAQWRSFSVEDFNALNAGQWASMATDDLNALSPAQWLSVATDDLNAMLPSQWQSLTPQSLEALGPQQWRQVSSNIVSTLGTAQWQMISTEDLRALTAMQWSALNTDALAALTTYQWQGLAPASLQALTDSQWAAVPADDLSSLLATQWQSMSTEDLAALTTAQWSSLPAETLNAILFSQWARVQADDLRALTPAQWQSMAVDDLDGLVIGYSYTATANGGLAYGGGGADCLIGGSGNDRLEAREGADRLFLSSGADCMSGGGGVDTLVIEQSPVQTVINAAGLTSNVVSTAFGLTTPMVSIDLGDTTVAQSISSSSSLRLLDTSIEVIDASGQQNSSVDLALIGNAIANTLVGGYGDDYIRSMTIGSNSDADGNLLAGGRGADYLRSGSGRDTLYGGTISGLAESADTIGDGDNTFFKDLFAPFSSASRTGTVFDHANIYEGRGGNDVLVASSGKDIFFYQTWSPQGSDTIYNFRLGEDFIFAVSQNSYPNGTDKVWFGDAAGASRDFGTSQQAFLASDTLPSSAILGFDGQNFSPSGSAPAWVLQNLGGGTYLIKFDADGNGTAEFTITLVGLAANITNVNELFPSG